jgi:hypothetical protein
MHSNYAFVTEAIANTGELSDSTLESMKTGIAEYTAQFKGANNL